MLSLDSECPSPGVIWNKVSVHQTGFLASDVPADNPARWGGGVGGGQSCERQEVRLMEEAWTRPDGGGEGPGSQAVTSPHPGAGVVKGRGEDGDLCSGPVPVGWKFSISLPAKWGQG